MIATENRCFQLIQRHPKRIFDIFVAWNPVEILSNQGAFRELLRLWVIPSLKIGNPTCQVRTRHRNGPNMRFLSGECSLKDTTAFACQSQEATNCFWSAKTSENGLFKYATPNFLWSFRKFHFRMLHNSRLSVPFVFVLQTFKAVPNVNDETKVIHGQSDHHVIQAFNSFVVINLYIGHTNKKQNTQKPFCSHRYLWINCGFQPFPMVSGWPPPDLDLGTKSTANRLSESEGQQSRIHQGMLCLMPAIDHYKQQEETYPHVFLKRNLGHTT